MPIFSAEDRDFWQRNGYIVVHNAVPADNNGWQQEMVLEGPGMKSDPNTGYGCLGGHKYTPKFGKVRQTL